MITKQLRLLTFMLLAFAGVSQGENQFILITKEVRWNDGMVCPVGEVELVIEYTPTAYVVWSANAKRYEVQRTHAKKITADEAAFRLMVHRQQMVNSLNTLVAQLQQPQQRQNQLDQTEQELDILLKLKEFTNRNNRELLNELKVLEQLRKMRKRR